MRKLLPFTVALALLSLAACQDDEVVSTPIDDSAITDRVKAAIVNDETLRALAIEVNTQDGVVQLSGFVENRLHIARAEEVTEDIDGVRAIRNELVLPEEFDRPDELEPPQ